MSTSNGKTFFEEKYTDNNGVEHDKFSYADVPIDEANGNAIATFEFLEATKSLLTLFDLLGKVKFGIVVSDMSNNIDKVERRYKSSAAISASLQELVRNELKEKKHEATEGLLWLSRSLQFTTVAIRNSVDKPNDELSKSFKDSYQNTLRPHHNFVTRTAVTSITGLVPYRSVFYDKLAGIDPTANLSEAQKNSQLDRMRSQLLPWLEALEKRGKILSEFIESKEAKWY